MKKQESNNEMSMSVLSEPTQHECLKNKHLTLPLLLPRKPWKIRHRPCDGLAGKQRLSKITGVKKLQLHIHKHISKFGPCSCTNSSRA